MGAPRLFAGSREADTRAPTLPRMHFAWARREGAPMKILLAVDGSPYTKHMLAYLAAHPELVAPGTEFSVLTVVPPVPAQVRHYIPHTDLQDYYTEHPHTLLRP